MLNVNKPKKIVKTKHFEMKPMYEEEAILQMEMLGHDFFMFFNVNEGKMCLLYKRQMGDLGMIISESL